MSLSSTPAPSAEILSFPASSPTPLNRPGLNQPGQPSQWCGVLYVARQLRLEAVDLRTVVTHIRAHIASSGFPAPVSSRLRRGVPLTGAAAVTPRSEWLRCAVDAWAEVRYGEGATRAADPERAARIDAALAARLARGGTA